MRSAACLFGKGGFNADVTAAAEEGTVVLYCLACAVVVLVSGELDEEGISIVGEEFGVDFDDATRIGPGLGLDESSDGADEWSGVRVDLVASVVVWNVHWILISANE